MRKILIILLICSFFSCKKNEIKLNLNELMSLDEIMQDKISNKIIIMSSSDCEICIPFKRKVKILVDSLNKNNHAEFKYPVSIYSISERDKRNKYVNAILRQMSFPNILFFNNKGEFKGLISSGRMDIFQSHIDYFEKNKNVWITSSKNMFKDLKLSPDQKTEYINDIFHLRNFDTIQNYSNLISQILSKDSINYFYKNYLLSKYYYEKGDSIKSSEYASFAEKTEFSNLDSALYDQFKVDLLRFRNNKKNEIKNFCFGIDGCSYIINKRDLKNNVVKIRLTNYFNEIIQLKNVTVDCSCYTIELPKQQILPKSSVFMYVKIVENTKNFDKTINIKSNIGHHNLRILIN
ncbi:DUF1573 domain-containing protein [Sphingobacterium spiritivorum]|uniref:DUF1573 domain-containing protein n=2 Tax=Sphingobacterium spiritivorum TaxID=258 RepID=UPI003DA2B04F